MDKRKVQSKDELKQELSDSRLAIVYRTDLLLEELDFVSKFRRSVKKNPLLWTAGAFAGAFALVKLLTPSKREVVIDPSQPSHAKIKPCPSRLANLASLGAGIAAPYVRRWAANILKDQVFLIKDKFFSSDTQH